MLTARALTEQGVRCGVPLGQLAGERSNLVAWLKVVCPLVFGQLYLQGRRVGAPQLPMGVALAVMAAATLMLPEAFQTTRCI